MNNRVKILYLYENLNIGGAEQLLLTTLKYLNRNKFYPVVYCIGEKGQISEEIEELGIKVVSLKRKVSLWNVRVIDALARIFRRENPDIVHCHLFYANYFGRIAAIFARVPIIIITEHGTSSNFKKFYHHWIDFLLSFFTSKIIVVSKAVQRYLARHTLILPYKTTIIYNSVDFDRFDNAYEMDKGLIRRRLGFVDSCLLIGCVSNLAPWKGQFFLLRAFAEVVKPFPNAKLGIVGRSTPCFKSQLEAFVQKNGLSENVYFLGERRDIPEILKALDIFVFPSLAEGLGISLLEAMYMGLPAVASRTEGILEIIEDNRDGILVPPGDSNALAEGIITLLKDPDKRRRICDNAAKKARSFSSPLSYIKRLESCYEDLIS